MREHVIAAIPGDGIGPEVIPAGLQALQALEKRTGGFRLRVEEFVWGSDYYRKNGTMMPADALDRLRRFDAIYFGAVGAPGIPDRSEEHTSELQSLAYLVCRLLLEKKKSNSTHIYRLV